MADSVRLALPQEAAAIAGVQRRFWAERLPADVRRALLASMSPEQSTAAWHTAITRPPEARFRVLVALADGRVVGFASTTPSPDADADPPRDGAVDEFGIDPPAQCQGHGSRLLHACADTLRADGFTRAQWWVSTGDDAVRAFLTKAGWGPDGSWREIGTEDESVRIKQIRLHTDISAAGPS